MTSIFTILAVLIIFAPSQVQCARILGILAFSVKSHNHGFGTLSAELARRGHDITVVTPFPIKNPPGRYRIIDAPYTREIFDKKFDLRKYLKLNLMQKLKVFYWNTAAETCPRLLNMPEVKELLNEKFDLVIVSMVYNECFMPFAYHNKAPLILYGPSGLYSWVSLGLGNPAPTSYVPDLFLPFSNEMTFLERVINTANSFSLQLIRQMVLMPRIDEYARKFYGESTPSILDIQSNTSLVLINNHVSLNYPKPLLPNIIEVGGLHIQDSNTPLPMDLQDFMNEAKYGVIYLSMGSLVRIEDISENIITEFIETFKNLPQHVIWKCSLDKLPGQPRNIKLRKWLPQEAILAHSNLRLFITHGGMLSIQEAAYYGVPLVGIPVMSDQQFNIRRSELLGVAVRVDVLNITQESLSRAIHRVLNNPSYATNAKILKMRVRDQPESPLERAVFWTEYVLRHNGAPHLRSVSSKLPWYQLYLLDVAIFIFIIIFFVIFVMRKFFSCCFETTRNVRYQWKAKKVQ